MTEYYTDPSEITPIEPDYNPNEVDPKVKNYTDQTRKKMKGKDVRESMARAAELTSITSQKAKQDSDEAIGIAREINKLAFGKYLEPVDTFADIETTYPDADENDRVFVREDGKTYVKQDGNWINFAQIDSTPYTELENRLSEDMANILKYQTNFVNAKNEGAVGDGVTDDSIVLNQLLRDNPYVFLPDGEYNLDTPLQLPFGHQLIGNNPQRVSLNANFENEFIITYGDEYYYNGYRGKIEGIRLKTSVSSLTAKPKGIYMNSGLAINEVDFYRIGQMISRSSSYIDLIEINKIYASYCVPNGEYLINIAGNNDALRINQLKFAPFTGDSTEYNGILIDKCHGGSIDNSILNCNVTINLSNGFSINNSHNEGVESVFRIKDSNISLRDMFKFKNSVVNDFIIETTETSGFQSIVNFDNVNTYLIGVKWEQFNTVSKEINKNGDSILSLKNCSRVINLGDRGRTSMVNTGFEVEGNEKFNNHSSLLSLNGMITSDESVDLDVKSSGIIPQASVGTLSVSSRMHWKKEGDEGETYYYRAMHVLDFERKLVNFKSAYNSVSNVTTGQYGVGIAVGRSDSINGKGGCYLLLRGNSITNFTEECRIPLTATDYLMDDGLTVNGYPWQQRTPSNGIDDYEMHDSVLIQNGRATTTYHRTPNLGNWEKYDRVINNSISDGNVKEWIYDGMQWRENGVW